MKNRILGVVALLLVSVMALSSCAVINAVGDFFTNIFNPPVEISADPLKTDMLINFADGANPDVLFESDGWSNGDVFNVVWKKQNVFYENGKEVGRELLSQAKEEPEAAEIIVGTKPSVFEQTETVRGETVSFATRYEYDSSLEAGKTEIRFHGADGYTESVYRISYYRGEEVSRELISTQTYAPVEKVVVIGTNENVYYMPFIDAAHGGYNYSVTQDFHSNHRGMDFGVWYGDPIVAIKSGKVIAAYDEGYFSKDNILWTYGTYVVVEHADGMRSYYAHLKSRTVSVGDTVTGGQIIGYSGNTGRTNPEPTAAKPLAGTHLHFEIRIKKNGVYVTTDPKAYLPYWN